MVISLNFSQFSQAARTASIPHRTVLESGHVSLVALAQMINLAYLVRRRVSVLLLVPSWPWLPLRPPVIVCAEMAKARAQTHRWHHFVPLLPPSHHPSSHPLSTTSSSTLSSRFHFPFPRDLFFIIRILDFKSCHCH